MSHTEVDNLSEAPEDKVGLMPEGEYALIYDTAGRAWSTEIIDGVRMKRRHCYAVELDVCER